MAMNAFESLATPALLVDYARLLSNTRRMSKRMSSLGVSLRPHAKTAKDSGAHFARLQAPLRGEPTGKIGSEHCAANNPEVHD